jgi:hypothetical protein
VCSPQLHPAIMVARRGGHAVKGQPAE